MNKEKKSITRKIKDLIWKILNSAGLAGPLQMMMIGELKENGWYKSFRRKQSIDKEGNPIPWNTYSFIKFIEPRLKSHFKVFEYGSGSSTLWYAKRVKLIKSVEHEKDWFEFISKKAPSNCTIIFRELNEDGDYAKEILSDNTLYDIVIVDGRDRNNSVRYAVQRLPEDGIIIFDNTQLPEYAPSIEWLLSNKFKKLEFAGILPVVAHSNTTTIFYKEANCLGI